MGEKKFREYFSYGITYQRENLFGHNILLEYSYHKINKENVIEFFRSAQDGPEIIGTFYGDMSLINHNIDIDYVGVISTYLSYGIGPSFVITNRILDIEESLHDKLASSGIGINAFLDFTVPIRFSKSSRFLFISSKLKLIYTYSIWFDEGIRNLEDYNQEFLTGQFTIGIGYSF